LDVSPGGVTLSLQDIRLVETAGLQNVDVSQPCGIRYVALSYCWGSPRPRILTTTSNLESQHKGIRFQELPKCLQDAVTVARGLEIRYLWIDALCIIQDDDNDWSREAGTMSEVYQNAYVTIAAAASESFDEGFLNTRSLDKIDMPFSSALNRHVVGAFSISVPPYLDGLPDLRGPMELDLRKSKWNTRGWVWQERLLSKRLLIFGKEMVHLQCEHGIHSENMTFMNNAYDIEGWHWYHADRTSWMRLLDDYLKKSFTYDEDKLPAIAGVAKVMDHRSIQNGEDPVHYIAGIWDHPQWRSELLWRTPNPGISFQKLLEQCKSTDAAAYTAPSWSWASRSTWVSWRWADMDSDELEAFVDYNAEIEDYKMLLTGPDLMGRVGPGSYLRLSGFTRRDPLDKADAVALPTRYHLHLDWAFSSAKLEYITSEYEVRLFGLLRITELRGYTDEFMGLLLLRDGATGHFYRIGLFEIAGRHVDLEDWERRSVCML